MEGGDVRLENELFQNNKTGMHTRARIPLISSTLGLSILKFHHGDDYEMGKKISICTKYLLSCLQRLAADYATIR